MKVRYNSDKNQIEFESGTELIHDTLKIPFDIEELESELDYSQLIQVIKFLTKDL